MKNFQTLLAAASVIAIAGAAHAAPTNPSPGPNGQRTFAFTPDAIDGPDAAHESTNFVSGDSITIGQTTTVDVQPYFYVQGSLGGSWTLNGWDANESTDKISELEIYHNADFTGHWSGFGNPTNGAGDELVMQVTESYETAPGGVGSGSQSKMLASDLNTTFANDSNPQSATKGYVKYTLAQTLTAPTSSPAGTYTVSPTITFTSN